MPGWLRTALRWSLWVVLSIAILGLIICSYYFYQATRFEVKRRADEEVLIADTKLTNAQQLATVNVEASGPRQTPERTQNAFGQTDAAGNDRSVSGALIPPDQLGHLAAMASATGLTASTSTPTARPDAAAMATMSPEPSTRARPHSGRSPSPSAARGYGVDGNVGIAPGNT